MTAIVVANAPRSDGYGTVVDHMPFSVRVKVAAELNRLWAEFVTDMHDGPTGGPEVADKFWTFVTGT